MCRALESPSPQGYSAGYKGSCRTIFIFDRGAIIFGAGVYEFRKLFTDGLTSDQILPFILGIVAAGVVGYLCIGFLLNYLKKRSVGIFVAYRLLFGGVVIILALIR